MVTLTQTTSTVSNAALKKDYEIAIDAYVDAEKRYKELEEHFLDGSALIEIMQRVNGNADLAKREWQSLVELLKNRLDEMNTLYVTARNAFRSAVAIGPTQQRGPIGKGSTISYGPFKVESATRRWFDPKDLIRGVTRHGMLDQLLSLTGFDREGKEYPLVEQTWKIDYQNVLKWLQTHQLQGVIDGAYEEEEQTPRVS